MKNIIKTCICLIVITSILLYSSISNAEPVYSVWYPTQGGAVLIESQIESSEVTGTDFRTATYEYNCDLTFDFSGVVDGYLSGYYTFEIYYSQVNTGNWQRSMANVFAEPFIGQYDTYRVFPVYMSTSTALQITVYFNNYPCFEGQNHHLPLGRYTWRYAMYNTSANNNDVNSSLTVNGNFTYKQSNFYFTANPITGQGFMALYKQAFYDALDAANLDLVYQYLVGWKTAQEGYLADIELSVDDLEQILTAISITVGDIYTTDINTYNKVVQIYNLLAQVFPSYSNTVMTRLSTIIARLDTIINQNASDTAAESQMQNAEQQLSQAVNNMDVQKPNINNVVNAGDQYLSQDITNSQNDTFFWLHGTNLLVTILTMAITVGIIGFVIYGKSG